MTVETSDRKQSFSGGQSVLEFSFRALVDSPEDIKVLVVTSGTETILTYSTDYSVAINADGIGGRVTVSPSYSTAYTYTVYRETTNTQPSDYDDYNQFPADTVEEDLDRRTMVSQETQEEIERTLKVPISSSITDLSLPTPSAGKSLIWNDTEDGIENSQYAGDSYAVAAAVAAATASTQATLAGLYASTATTAAVLAGNYATTASSEALSLKKSSIEFILDGNGVAIPTGSSGWIEIPFPCTITTCRLFANTTGSIKIDLWRDSYANYPPTDADSICGGNEPEISSGIKDEDVTVPSWSTSCPSGSVIYVNVDSCSTISRCLLSLTIQRGV